jgi:hypothetical protein
VNNTACLAPGLFWPKFLTARYCTCSKKAPGAPNGAPIQIPRTQIATSSCHEASCPLSGGRAPPSRPRDAGASDDALGGHFALLHHGGERAKMTGMQSRAPFWGRGGLDRGRRCPIGLDSSRGEGPRGPWDDSVSGHCNLVRWSAAGGVTVCAKGGRGTISFRTPKWASMTETGLFGYKITYHFGSGASEEVRTPASRIISLRFRCKIIDRCFSNFCPCH